MFHKNIRTVQQMVKIRCFWIFMCQSIKFFIQPHTHCHKLHTWMDDLTCSDSSSLLWSSCWLPLYFRMDSCWAKLLDIWSRISRLDIKQTHGNIKSTDVSANSNFPFIASQYPEESIASSRAYCHIDFSLKFMAHYCGNIITAKSRDKQTGMKCFSW